MSSGRALTLAPVVVAAGLLALSCGGGSSPSAPPVDATPQPVATPAPGGEGASASSCPIGKGDPDATCTRRSPQLLAAMDAAIDRLVRDRPELFNRLEEASPGSGLYRVLDSERYLDGVVANLRASGLCAERTLDLERVVVKSTNDFSEEWDVLASSGFIRRGGGSYLQTCEPAVFPVEASDLIAYLWIGFFRFDCAAGVVAPEEWEQALPLGCAGFVTATPKLRNGRNVPAWIHGTDVHWELREGSAVVTVDPDPWFGNPFNKVLSPKGALGGFVLCATVHGKERCLNGRTIP